MTMTRRRRHPNHLVELCGLCTRVWLPPQRYPVHGVVVMMSNQRPPYGRPLRVPANVIISIAVVTPLHSCCRCLPTLTTTTALPPTAITNVPSGPGGATLGGGTAPRCRSPTPRAVAAQPPINAEPRAHDEVVQVRQYGCGCSNRRRPPPAPTAVALAGNVGIV